MIYEANHNPRYATITSAKTSKPVTPNKKGVYVYTFQKSNFELNCNINDRD